MIKMNFIYENNSIIKLIICDENSDSYKKYGVITKSLLPSF